MSEPMREPNGPAMTDTTVTIHRGGRGDVFGCVGDVFVIAWPRFGAWSWSAIRTVEDAPGERIGSGEGVAGASVAIAEAIAVAAKALNIKVVGFVVEGPA